MRYGNEQQPEVFGLSREQVLPVLERVCEEPLQDFELSDERLVMGFPGWVGQKMIPVFTCTTSRGEQRLVTLFVKRLRPGAREAMHADYLLAHGLHVARMYGVAQGQQGEEIIFYECLERIFNAIDASYSQVRRQFLSMLAQFHTLPVTDEYRAQRHIRNPTAHLATDTVEYMLQHLWQYASERRLGTKLQQLCMEHREKIPQLCRWATEIARRVSMFPSGLVNGEFGLGSVPGSDEWRLFDLHSIGWGPRFTDLAYIFGQPEGLHTVYGTTWCDDRALAEYYLEKLHEYGGPYVSVETLYEETRLLWLANAFQQNWLIDLALTGEVIWTPNRKAGKRHCRSQLYQVIEYLLLHVPEDICALSSLYEDYSISDIYRL